jgi:hypothetical protein
LRNIDSLVSWLKSGPGNRAASIELLSAPILISIQIILIPLIFKYGNTGDLNKFIQIVSSVGLINILTLFSGNSYYQFKITQEITRGSLSKNLAFEQKKANQYTSLLLIIFILLIFFISFKINVIHIIFAAGLVFCDFQSARHETILRSINRADVVAVISLSKQIISSFVSLTAYYFIPNIFVLFGAQIICSVIVFMIYKNRFDIDEIIKNNTNETCFLEKISHERRRYMANIFMGVFHQQSRVGFIPLIMSLIFSNLIFAYYIFFYRINNTLQSVLSKIIHAYYFQISTFVNDFEVHEKYFKSGAIVLLLISSSYSSVFFVGSKYLSIEIDIYMWIFLTGICMVQILLSFTGIFMEVTNRFGLIAYIGILDVFIISSGFLIIDSPSLYSYFFILVLFSRIAYLVYSITRFKAILLSENHGKVTLLGPGGSTKL